MKQSKKLLSIFLAILMLLGTVSVIGNAGYQKSTMAYDAVDNPAPNPDQVANLVLDVLDELLADMDFYENFVVVKLDLRSVDKALDTLWSFNGLKGIAGGDIANLDLSAVKSPRRGYSGANSDDTNVLYAVLQFLNNNADVLSKAAYGIGTDNGIDLGWLIDLIGLDLGDIGTLLEDIPAFLVKTVYDMLIHGSYNANYPEYDKSYPSVEDLEAAGKALPAEADSLDEIINTAVTTFLTKPQNYEYVPTGEYTTDEDGNQVPVTKKVWDENSYILTADKIAGKDLTLTNNSVFTILDQCLQIAYEDFGTVALNHDLKKIFMEAMDVDFVELDKNNAKDLAEINAAKADPDYIDVENTNVDASDVKNYFCDAQMWKVGDTWYFRDYVTRPVLDANGNLQYETDDEGNQVVITALQHRYQRAEAYDVNDLYYIFNWDYKLTDDTFNFDQLVPQYGSIIGCLNHILHVVLETAINPAALGISSIDELWADGGNDQFNENLMKTAKFLLKNFTFEFFGRNPLYVDLNTLKANSAFIAKVDSFGNDAAGREGLIAYMLLPFLGDALPQLVYDLDMFTAGLQIEQVAALLVREFLSDLTPQINYDAEIFVDPTLASGRTFKTKTSAQWFELILNMGLDLGATYLDNICNINLNAENLAKVKSYAVAAGDPAWKGVLEEIVDYAINYIGTGAESVLDGCGPTTLSAIRCVGDYDYTTDSATISNNYAGNALENLSIILNKLLPLGLLCNVSSGTHALDVEMLLNRLIDVIDDLDLEVLLATFGRNNRDDNLLGTKNIVNQLLGNLINPLINVLLGFNLFPVTSSLNAAVTQANLKTIVANLLKSLYNRRLGLLPNALPIVASFVDDWGSEQAIRTPELSLNEVTYASNGSLNYTVTVSNGSRGIWRGYMKDGVRVQDEQYAYNIQSITSAQGITVGSGYAGKVDYGSTKTFTLSGTIPASGLGDRIDVTYQVYNEDGQLMENGKSYAKAFFTYFAYDSNEWNHTNREDYQQFVKKAIVFASEPDENGKLPYTDEMVDVGNQDYGKFYHEKASNGKHYSFEPQSQPGNGFTAVASSNDSCDKEKDYWYKPVTFNSANYTAPDAVAGQTLSFTFKAYSKYTSWGSTKYAGWHEKDQSSYPTTYIKIYDPIAMDELRSLVNEETGLNRRPETYKDQDAYFNYLVTLGQAIAVAWNPGIDGSFTTDSTTIRLALEETIATLEASKMTPAEQAAAGLATVDAAVNQLEETLKSVDGGFNGKDYRTYMLYRWSRYQDAKKDANYAINLAAEYNAGLQTQKFTYSSMPVYTLKEVVAGDKYSAYILALLENLNDEEAAQAKERFKEVTRNYGGYTTLDIAQMSNLVTRMAGRLIPREGGVVNTYLSKEIESAKKEIGSTNTAGYSERSWTAYATALAEAQAAMTSDSQDVIFAAKYALQVARNNLRTEAEEADYSELETLMAQAEQIFKNANVKSVYDNTDAEIGAVLGAWGYTTTNGTDTVIFPYSAKAVNGRSYDKGDQEEVDDAADALKVALSKMVFKGVSYGGNTVTSSSVPTGEVDADENPIMETVKTTVIDAKQIISAVKSKFESTTATGATDTDVRISLDDSYTIDTGDEKFVGTGATITIYTTQSGVKIPVSTIKVVVKGDVTGDGVIDVLDCMIVELSATNNTTVTGVYNLAGDIAANGAVDINDLGEVANIAKNTH